MHMCRCYGMLVSDGCGRRGDIRQVRQLMLEPRRVVIRKFGTLGGR